MLLFFMHCGLGFLYSFPDFPQHALPVTSNAVDIMMKLKGDCTMSETIHCPVIERNNAFLHTRPVDHYTYFETKKQTGLFFTLKNINPDLPADSMISGHTPVSAPGVSYWDRKRGRYRTYEEQQEYLREIGALPKTAPSPKGEGEKPARTLLVASKPKAA